MPQMLLDFVSSLVSNLCATFVGALLGIFIALGLDRWQRKRQENRDKEIQAGIERAHQIKILKLILEELQSNRIAISSRQPQAPDETSRRLLPNNPLKNELWLTFSDGGELQWIKDAILLATISNTYHYIKRVIYLEDKLFEQVHYQGPIFNLRTDYIESYLIAIDSVALEQIIKAINEIQETLNKLEKITDVHD